MYENQYAASPISALEVHRVSFEHNAEHRISYSPTMD